MKTFKFIPPCNVGEDIYQIRPKKHRLGECLYKRRVKGFMVWGAEDYEILHSGMHACTSSDFGKTWFLDKEQKGKTFEFTPPCNVDDAIYQLRSKNHKLGTGISKRWVSCFIVFGKDKYQVHHDGMNPCRGTDFGKTWFLTKEEAIEALRKKWVK